MIRSRLSLAILLSFVVALLVGAAVFLYMPTATNTTVTSTGKALVGGPFTLTDQDGKRVSDADFRGKYMLVYFGYTFCPDVCPTELQVMTSAIGQMDKAQADRVQPIFITVDPERDTVENMKLYVSNFGERLIGLTGSAEDVTTATKAYRIYSSKVKDDGSTAEYLMDHTSLVFLMGPQGDFLRVFSYGTDAETMAKGITEELQKSGA
ncbi:protein SCO1/2 [Rhodoligotrophos appendicifer]|uniref:SCO family protein n=1 Tax=Rhodoligotrophos appendicifer TaxID=987056 RepID=UPI0019620352|nr:SCO family protein [Rhodoligotrophos appendicifer]